MSNTPVSPLESFVRDYAEVTGGVWDEIEPQVYDLLLPAEKADDDLNAIGDREILRVAFDPEAVPEHPGSQLAGLGSPLIDRLLDHAVRQGSFGRASVTGLNLSPHNLESRVRRALACEGLELATGPPRALNFPQAVFWFEAEFVSDQKEQQVLNVAIDLHYARQTRHLDKLLEEATLSDEPAALLPEAGGCPLDEAYGLARDRVVRTLSGIAGSRRRELDQQVERQVARMERYYADMRDEVAAQQQRARDRQQDVNKFTARREALIREEQLRVTELRRKSTLRVELRLLSVLVVGQPKLRLPATLGRPKHESAPIALVWDPLTETLEAPPCPQCRQPTLVFRPDRLSRAGCPHCVS